MMDKLKAWFNKLMNSLDPTVALHSVAFLSYAATVLLMMMVWFTIELIRRGDLKIWSSTMATMFLIAGGSHAIGTAVDKIGKGGGE